MTTMPKNEHIAMVNELVGRHRHESEPGGNDMIAAEMLWGAFAHALIAVANENEWPHNSHGALKQASLRLAREQNLPVWANDFASAERLHTHFYHGRSSQKSLSADTKNTFRGIQGLMQLLVGA